MALYEDPPCPLDYQTPFQLLVAVILSAQSTDKKVNEITPALFALAPDAQAMAALEVSYIEAVIKQIGLAPTKAKNISNMSKRLVEVHGGEVPGTFEELEQLAGVGHKTASVVLAVAFKVATFPVDTHIHRLAQRWGLTSGKNVEQSEADLKVLFREETWNPLHLRIIYFGREHCKAAPHDPTVCPICMWAAVPPFHRPGSSPLKAGQSGLPRKLSQPATTTVGSAPQSAQAKPVSRKRPTMAGKAVEVVAPVSEGALAAETVALRKGRQRRK
ncbi:hypothetical protein WJX72_010483 [[Myrmecia] bisecta]|uniref:HhH-GPD domain-containing protein n=1 Tax=[Myrmecia] bisecta TaxID=41462 RepID=A0AAW1Q8L8_9CHLO